MSARHGKALTELQRRVLALHEGGFSAENIACVTGYSVSYLNKQIKLAKKKQGSKAEWWEGLPIKVARMLERHLGVRSRVDVCRVIGDGRLERAQASIPQYGPATHEKVLEWARGKEGA